jgi:hypothetical protein
MVITTLLYPHTGFWAVEKSALWVMLKWVKMASKLDFIFNLLKWCKLQGGGLGILLIASFKKMIEWRRKVCPVGQTYINKNSQKKKKKKKKGWAQVFIRGHACAMN